MPFYAIFWFMAGDYMLGKLNKFNPLLSLVAFAVLSVLELIFQNEYWSYFRIPIIMIGIIAMWNIYDRIVGECFDLNTHRLLSLMCQFTFFVYLFHEPTLNIVRKLLLIPLGHTSLGFALDYLLSPWIFIALFTVLGYCFRKHFPFLYGICVGGR